MSHTDTDTDTDICVYNDGEPVKYPAGTADYFEKGFPPGKDRMNEFMNNIIEKNKPKSFVKKDLEFLFFEKPSKLTAAVPSALILLGSRKTSGLPSSPFW